MRASDCSTAVGILRADEAAGICAKLETGEATTAINKPTGTNRGKLTDINLEILLKD
jgi:hypothetical protein